MAAKIKEATRKRVKKQEPVLVESDEVKTNEVATVQVVEHKVPVLAHTPDMLLAIALEKGYVDQLEKLMALQNQWLDRQARSLYLQAKSDFQSEVPTLSKKKSVDFSTKDGGGVNWYYAPLGTIASVLKPLLKKFGLSYDWAIDDQVKDADGKPMIKITCLISHVGGHTQGTSMSGYLDTSGNKTAMHSRSSTVSYLQRYTLIAALGLSTDDVDNDGTKAANPQVTVVKKQPVSQVNFEKLLFRAKAGEKVLERAKEQLALTEKQIEALQIIEDNQTANETTVK